MNVKNRLTELFQLYYDGAATKVETAELMELLADKTDEELSDLLQDTWKDQNVNPSFFSSDTRDKMLAKLFTDEDKGAHVHQLHSEKKVFSLRKVAMAAAIILVLAISAFFFWRKAEDRQTAIHPPLPDIQKDIAPGGDRATLTLADGRKIILDSAANGDLAKQGGVTVIKIGGQLAYNTEGKTTEVLYNTISTPKGGQYQLLLADGSKVWLNAASSLRFPTSFAGDERTVVLTGEGYFEVAHNATMPFHVKVNDVDVKVLGTHFNINAYQDEPMIRTTLLEGRVNIKKEDKHVFLNPGQQAQIPGGTSSSIRVMDEVDVEEVVAWKNGRFLYNSAGIETIMRQAERWYDVDVSYEGKTNETFSGNLSRSVNISQLLKIMEATGKVEFKINGKQIMVKPK